MIPYKFIKAFSGKSDSVFPDRYRKETGRLTDIIAVIRREVRLIRQRPVYLTASVGTFTFCIVFFLTFFREGIPHDLPIGIVDNDCSSLSREIRRQLDVTELGKTCIFGNYREAREALQTGSINAFCVIPENFSEDVQAGRQPVFTFYVNSLYFVGGSLAYKDVLTMANLASGAVQREILTAKGMDKTEMAGMLQPIVIDAHQIGNTTTDYGVYLTNVLLPGILELIIILVTVYSTGAELKYGTSRHLLEKAGNSTITALTGKLVPYTILFLILGLTCNIILYRWAGFPLKVNLPDMAVGMILFVLACEAVAIFIVGTIPVLRTAISVSAIYSVLAFSMAGFTFPVEAMPPYIQGISVLFPLRHYYLFYVQEAIFGAGFGGWWEEAVHMGIFLFLPFLVLKRLGKAYRRLDYPRN